MVGNTSKIDKIFWSLNQQATNYFIVPRSGKIIGEGRILTSVLFRSIKEDQFL